jgi:hypothetical protein
MTRIQLFAHEIATNDTATVNAALVARGCNPATMSPTELLKQQAQLQADLITQQVLPKADPTALPIFMAPEFFFKAYDGLPYDRATFFNGSEALKDLSRGFPDVLWCVGTIWWQEPTKAGQALVHNTALLIRGGVIVHSWQKERLSGIDGLKEDGTEAWDRWKPEYAHVLDDTQHPVFRLPALAGQPAASAGIEVCLDHLTLNSGPHPEGVLRRAYLEDNGTQGGGLDVHLLVAAGMPTQSENVVAKSGGYFLRIDGGGGASPRSQCRRVGRQGASAPAALRQWAPTFVDSAATYVGNDPDNRLAIYPAVDIS